MEPKGLEFLSRDHEIVPLEYKDSIYESNKGPYIVREALITGLDDEEVAENLEKKRAEFVLAQQHFDRLKNKFGVNIPDFQIVIGKDENQKTGIYTLVKKVEGKNLDNLTEADVNPELLKNTEAYFVGLTKYYQDSFINKSGALGDIGQSFQAMYGTVEGSNEKKVYLVDIDPYVVSFGKYAFLNSLNILSNYILHSERRLKVKFLEVKSLISEILKGFSAEDKSHLIFLEELIQD